jgi:ribose transport system permease protein
MRDSAQTLASSRALVMSYGLYVFLAALIVFFGFVSHSFLSVSNWVQLGIASCFLLTSAAGLTVVMITANIDLSVGSIAYLAAAVVYLTADAGATVSVIAAILTGMGAGLISGVLVSYLRMNSLLTTLGLMISYRGLSLVLTDGTVHPVGDTIALMGRFKVAGVAPLVLLISLVVVVVVQIAMSSTRFGVYCYAIGNSEAAARKLGVPTRAVILAAFCVSGVCGALSGLLSSMYLGEVTTFVGRGMEFQAVAAAVIGGTSLFGGRGNVFPGTLAGVLLLTVINNGLGTWGVSPYVYPFVAGTVIFVAIYLDSLKNLRPSRSRLAR